MPIRAHLSRFHESPRRQGTNELENAIHHTQASASSHDPSPAHEPAPSSTTSDERTSSATHRAHEHGRDQAEKHDLSLTVQIRKTVLRSWLNLLLALIPVGFALYYAHANSIAIFCINLVAMLPSVIIIAYVADDIVLRFGDTTGALISSTFNNAATFITSILLLRARQIAVLQSSFVGAILANLLLSPGLCFLTGGMKYKYQAFNDTTARTLGTLLFLAILTIFTTTAYRSLAANDSGIVPQSRSSAMILIISYCLFIIFQTRTHRDMFDVPITRDSTAPPKHEKPHPGDIYKTLAAAGATTAAASSTSAAEAIYREHRKRWREPELSISFAVITLTLSTALLTLNTLFATNSLSALLSVVSPEFVGLVLIPVLSSDPTTITVALKDDQDLVMALTLGKSVQIVLFIIPLLILINWSGLGGDSPPLTLSFDSWQVSLLLGSILIINFILQEGRSHWLIGALLLALYINIAVDVWYYPVFSNLSG